MKPVAWMYDFLNSDNRDEVIRNWVTQDIADIEREKGFNVRPLYAAPPKHEWVGLTDEDIAQGTKESWVDVQAFESVAWWADAKLKDKNHG